MNGKKILLFFYISSVAWGLQVGIGVFNKDYSINLQLGVQVVSLEVNIIVAC